ncbi:hypothetical protein Hanom_Chr16g01423791 [Helianthus anomalus]
MRVATGGGALELVLECNLNPLLDMNVEGIRALGSLVVGVSECGIWGVGPHKLYI